MKQYGTWTLSISLLAAVACGGGAADTAGDSQGSTGSEAASSGGEQASSAEAGASVAWDDMTPEQKGAFMKETVVPEMKALFQEHDPEHFADFGCKTCHGENPKEVGFEMPNGVAPLDPAQIGAIFQSDKPMAQLMTQRVWPRMAELLQKPQFNPETGEGFSCFHCHAKKGE